jgi:phage terminase large subunit
MPEFNLLRGGLQDRFLTSRAKIQIFGGGFGNGKTTAVVMKALQLSQYYPGMNVLMARSTYPKLNDTLRKEFIRWCPAEWIKSFPKSQQSDNTCTLHNGTTFNFRYVSQQGKSQESSTSNLLSATYDAIVVDQAEDPEITYKDFLDLLGRLRGSTMYRGTDPNMPHTGPRWMMLTLNPSRNWVFTELIQPYFQYFGHGQPGELDYYPGGVLTDKLLCIRSENGYPIRDENGKPQMLIEIVEGSTYENKHNLPADFIQTQETAYRGQMRDRYLLGKWAAYEGLVYPQFDEQLHMVSEGRIRTYRDRLLSEGYELEWIEGYDFGQTAPSCYLLSFVDPHGNIVVADGYYQRDYALELQYPHIKEMRRTWGANSGFISADPDIFSKRWNAKTGTSIADLFWSEGDLMVQRGDKSNNHGITKVSGYLNARPGWRNPFTGDTTAPTIYFNSKLRFIADEMASWFWKKDKNDQRIDEPQDGNDHSLDTIKYMVTTRPDVSKLKPSVGRGVPAWLLWHERDVAEVRSRRHG